MLTERHPDPKTSHDTGARAQPSFAGHVPAAPTSERNRLQQYSHFSSPVHALLGAVVGDRLVANLLGFNFDAQPWHVSQFFDAIHPDDHIQVQAAALTTTSFSAQPRVMRPPQMYGLARAGKLRNAMKMARLYVLLA